MKVIIVLVALIAIVAARPTAEDAAATILKSTNTNTGAGQWHWDWESSNGIKQEESGHVVNEGSKDESIAVRGIFQWTDQNGETYSVSYIADDNGFQPEGAHLPKAEQ